MERRTFDTQWLAAAPSTKGLSTNSVDDSVTAKREAAVIAEAFTKALVVPRQKSHTDLPIEVKVFEC